MTTPDQEQAQYNAIQVANKFIELGRKDGITDLSNMKLQKLVFYAHSIMLGDNGRPLIGEKFHAWKYGPVVYELYAALLSFCGKQNWNRKHCFSENLPDDAPPITDQEALRAISDAWEVCGRSSPSKLVQMTHLPGTPWSTVYESSGNDAIISNAQIRDYMRNPPKRQVV